MAKYNITRSCGHEETIQIAGPVKDRARRAAYEEGRLCRACWTAERDQQRAQQTQAAAAQAQAAGMACLQGTVNQVSWAETLRSEVIAALRRRQDQLVGAEVESAAAIIRFLERVEEAGWWIDHYRDQSVAELRALVREVAPLVSPELAARAAQYEAAQAAAREAQQAAAQERARRRADEQQQAAAEAQVARQRAAAAVADFEPIAAVRRGDDVTLTDSAGRVARGYYDGGLCIYEVAGIPTPGAAADGLARRAGQMLAGGAP